MAPAPHAADTVADAAQARLRYLGTRAQVLRGPSGRTYRVAPGTAPIAVLASDTPALLRTGLFGPALP